MADLSYDIILRLHKPLPIGGQVRVKYLDEVIVTDAVEGQEDYPLPKMFEKMLKLKVFTQV